MLRAQNHVLRCAQPALRWLLRKTAILTQMLRPRDSATANSCPAVYLVQRIIAACVVVLWPQSSLDEESVPTLGVLDDEQKERF